MILPGVNLSSNSGSWALRAGAAGVLALILSLSCGGGGGGAPQPAQVLVSASNSAGNPGWEVIGVKVQSLVLVQEDGTSVQIFNAPPSEGTEVNLAQLGQDEAMVGQFPVPSGAYTGAVASLSANPGDIELIASATPQAGTGYPPNVGRTGMVAPTSRTGSFGMYN